MNKQKFIEYLRSPESLTEGQYNELKDILVDYPYFSIARSMAARAAKELDDAEKGNMISSAAIYSIDRKHLKKYINGELVFLEEKPAIQDEEEHVAEVQEKPEKTPSSDIQAEKPLEKSEQEPQKPTEKPEEPQPQVVEEQPKGTPPAPTDVDQMIDELQRDMEALKKSRGHFVEIQSQIEEEEAVSAALRKAAEVAKEIEFEESKTTTEPEKKETEVSEQEKPPVEQSMEENAEPEDTAQTSTPAIEEDIEDDIENELTEKPKVVTPEAEKSKFITNMDGDEDLDDEDEEDDLPEAKSAGTKSKEDKPKPKRQKVKRSDLDKLMHEVAKAKKAAVEETREEDQKEEESKKAEKEEQPTTETGGEDKKEVKSTTKKKSTKTTAKATKTAAKKKQTKKAEETKTDKEAEEAQPAAKKKTSKKEPEAEPVAKTPKEDDHKDDAEDKKDSKTEETKKEDTSEAPVISSARAFMDFGKTEGTRLTSVSRASSSRRRRKRSSDPSKSDTPKNQDDDDSGGGGETDQIIERFIAENPSIERRPGKTSKVDLSANSTEWKPEISSEYLAEIYLKQGNKERAIEIYKALMVKFPEKSLYFADLVRKIED